MLSEVLAPVGGREQLEAAIKAGADAVYLAGTSFGARSSAANFDRQQLVEAIKYAHLHDVSVYITVNTLIMDSEFDSAMGFVDFLYQNGADALIVQDIGLMSAIRSRYPDFELHASTQMTFHNLEGVKYAKSLGFSRVVLPREMRLSEIQRISDEVEIELEVFVHGALCVSYSGMCLMSSYIGGRSGNRGSCAQPCRKRYSLYSLDAEHKFHVEDVRILSPKDLSAVDAMGELLKIPNISLKIEGRLKDQYYVYNVVSAYRKLVDGDITAAKAVRQLEKSYNRGYTKGFLLGEKITDFRAGEHTGHRGTMLGRVVGFQDGTLRIRLEDSLSKGDEVQCRRPDGTSVGARADRIEKGGENVAFAPSGSIVSIPFKHRVFKDEILYKTFSAEQNTSIDRELHSDIKPWKILLKARFRMGENLRLTALLYRAKDEIGAQEPLFSEEVVGEIAEQATGKGTDKIRIVAQLSKTGGTPFELSAESVFDIDEGIFVPISSINAMRRSIFDRLTARLEKRHPHLEKREKKETPFVEESWEPDLSLLENDSRTASADSRTASADSRTASVDSRSESEDVLVLPPIISTEDWERYQECVDQAKIIEIGHLSHLAFKGLENKVLIGSYTLNIMNAHALRFYLERGVSRTEISTEIDRGMVDVEAFAGKSGGGSPIVNLERSRITLMRMAYCPVGAYFGGGQKCGLCKKYSFALRDEKDVEFPLHLDSRTCMAEILSPGGKWKGKKITDIVI